MAWVAVLSYRVSDSITGSNEVWVVSLLLRSRSKEVWLIALLCMGRYFSYRVADSTPRSNEVWLASVLLGLDPTSVG